MNDIRIEKLNKSIIKYQHKIRNLKIRDTVFSIAPGAGLVIGVTIYTAIDSDNIILSYSYPYLLFISIGLGLIPMCIDNNLKLNQKIEKYNTIIKNNLDELHGYALEENRKIMKKEL